MKVVKQNLKRPRRLNKIPTRKSLWPDGFVLSSAVSNFFSKIDNAFKALEPPSSPLTTIKL